MRRLAAALIGLLAVAGFVATAVADDSGSVSLTVAESPDGYQPAVSADLESLDHKSEVPASASGRQDSPAFTDLDAGRYRLRVSAPSPAVDLSALACQPDDAVAWVDVSTGTAVLDVASGQQVSCTTQGQRRGHVTVRTVTQPPSPDPAAVVTPSWWTPFPQTDGEMHRSPALPAGSHAVQVDAMDGWDVTATTCDNGSDLDEVAVAPGDEVTCTIRAAQRGMITIEASAEPERDRRFVVDPSWGRPMRVATDAAKDSRPLRAGSHALAANLPDGWDLASFTCDDGSPVDAIEVSAGEHVTCTLSATKRGTVAVELTTEPTGASPDVTFDPSWGREFSLADQGVRVSRPLRPREQSVAVSTTRGWDVTSSRCTGGHTLELIDLGPGRNVECAVTLTQRGSVTVVAQTRPEGSNVSFGYSPSWGDDFTLTDGQSATSRRLKPGTYSLVSDAPGGWSAGTTTCDDGSIPTEITLDPGEDVTCTFTYARPQFTVASFNILGDSHSGPGGYAARYASGATRMGWTVGLLGARGVDVIGMQEVQPSQALAFLRRAGDFAMYPGPGSSLRYRQNVVAWRTSMFELVEARPNLTPYLNGNQVSMPVVKLRHRASGQEVYVISVHNAASIARTGNNDRWRNAAMRQQVQLTSRLLATGTPVIMTGDMNSRTPYFCAYTRSGQMKAAAGGSTGARCQPPSAKQAGIDWIFGSRDIGFSGYAKLKSSVVGRISDHPFIVAEALIRR